MVRKIGRDFGEPQVQGDPENLWKFRIVSNVAGMTGRVTCDVIAG